MPQECWNSTGPNGGYSGYVSVTRKGRTCQNWNTDEPHNPISWPKDNRDHNYCRNPDGDPKGPWCYTTDPNRVFELCNIPNCKDRTTTTTTKTTTTSTTTTVKTTTTTTKITTTTTTTTSTTTTVKTTTTTTKITTTTSTTTTIKTTTTATTTKTSTTAISDMATTCGFSSFTDGTALYPTGEMILEQDRILHGTRALDTEFPWQVRLHGPATCGGTLVSLQVILMVLIIYLQ